MLNKDYQVKEDIRWTKKIILAKKGAILKLRRKVLILERELENEEEELKELIKLSSNLYQM